MPLGALTPNLAEFLVQRRINCQRFVIFIEQVRHALFLVLRIEGVRRKLANPDLFYALRQRQLSDPAARLELLSLFFSPHTAAHHPELVNQALQAFSARAPDSQARRSRVTQQFNSEGRLAGISARTLVLGAMQDRVIDPLNTWRIAQEIPGATLTMLGGVGHALAFEAPGRTARVIADFLQDRARG